MFHPDGSVDDRFGPLCRAMPFKFHSTTLQPACGWVGNRAVERRFAPLMYHTANAPFVYWKRRSEMPSPLKSPTPTSFQPGSTARLMTTWPVTVTPLRDQMAT